MSARSEDEMSHTRVRGKTTPLSGDDVIRRVTRIAKTNKAGPPPSATREDFKANLVRWASRTYLAWQSPNRLSWCRIGKIPRKIARESTKLAMMRKIEQKRRLSVYALELEDDGCGYVEIDTWGMAQGREKEDERPGRHKDGVSCEMIGRARPSGAECSSARLHLLTGASGRDPLGNRGILMAGKASP